MTALPISHNDCLTPPAGFQVSHHPSHAQKSHRNSVLFFQLHQADDEADGGFSCKHDIAQSHEGCRGLRYKTHPQNKIQTTHDILAVMIPHNDNRLQPPPSGVHYLSRQWDKWLCITIGRTAALVFLS